VFWLGNLDGKENFGELIRNGDNIKMDFMTTFCKKFSAAAEQ